jgi:two-component system cell cycle sensor histidine kinase/response regulator CckA
MDDRKALFIEDQITRLTQVWLGKVILVGLALFPLLGIMDYFVAPDLFPTFMLYRCGITAVLAVIYLFNRLRLDKYYQYTLLLVGTALCAATIELMIMKLGGDRSFYYAGLNLVAIAALGFIPMGLIVSFLCVLIIYAIYVLPIVIIGGVTAAPVFISNNAFLIATFTIALSWRDLVQRRLVAEIGLQFDLAEEHTKLEELVRERTSMYLESEHSYRSLFENAMDGIMVIDQQGIIVKANEKAHRIHAFSPDALIGTNLQLLQREQHREKLATVLLRVLRGENLHYETEHYRKDGSLLSLEASANRVVLNNNTYIQLIMRDITEKKKIQDHLIQSQKMESVATLAGGIAHDLNNVLTAIIGYTGIIRHKIDDAAADPKVIDGLNVVERAARNGSRMISQLMDFSRRKKPEMRPTAVNDIVTDTAKLMERVLDTKIHIDLRLDPVLPRVSGDITHLSQAVMNLVVNARDAMPNGGVITLTTSFCSRQNIHTFAPPYVPAADYVVLQVKDTGTGIPEEVKARMFEPFFTTKERGKGTGLGLAMVYSVVTNHRGYLAVASELNAGTTFTLFFPAITNEALHSIAAAPVRGRGQATILVIEDDEMNMNFIKETLEQENFLVTATTNPLSGLELFRNGSDRYTLIITDVIMPIISGHELVSRIREIKPEQRILTITGSADALDREAGRPGSLVLRKPFDSAALISNVRQALSQ